MSVVPAPGRARGRLLARAAVATPLLAAAALAIAAFGALASVDLASLEPLAVPGRWLVVLVVAAVLAAAAVVLALVACVRCRPRGLAVVGLVLAVVLPVPVTGFAVTAGGHALRDNAVADLRTDASLVLRGVDLLESWNVPVDGLRESLTTLTGPVR